MHFFPFGQEKVFFLYALVRSLLKMLISFLIFIVSEPKDFSDFAETVR